MSWSLLAYFTWFGTASLIDEHWYYAKQLS